MILIIEFPGDYRPQSLIIEPVAGSQFLGGGGTAERM
jgi:hypothetical protein